MPTTPVSRCSDEPERLPVIHITDTTVFDESEIQERVVRAAIELRLDLEQSSLPPDVKRRLIAVGWAGCCQAAPKSLTWTGKVPTGHEKSAARRVAGRAGMSRCAVP